MTAHQIREVVKRQPFLPVQLILNNGDSVLIRDPELALITTSCVLLARPSPEDVSIPGDYQTLISIQNIARIEVDATEAVHD